jgi:hypothetical protein
MANLTPTAIDALRAGCRLTDKTPGLVVVALSPEKKVFRYSRRVPATDKRAQRVHNATLGPFPSFNVVEAREWAQAFNAMIDRGIDPLEAQAAAQKAEMTVAEAHALYMVAVNAGMHKTRQRKLKPRTIEDKEGIYRVDIGPNLGSTALIEVTSDKLWDMVLDKGDPDSGNAPVRANRLAAELKVFFKFCCMRNGSKAIGLRSDPASSLSGSYFEETPRTRFLSEQEIGWLFKALATEKRRYCFRSRRGGDRFSRSILTGCFRQTARMMGRRLMAGTRFSTEFRRRWRSSPGRKLRTSTRTICGGRSARIPSASVSIETLRKPSCTTRKPGWTKSTTSTTSRMRRPKRWRNGKTT